MSARDYCISKDIFRLAFLVMVFVVSCGIAHASEDLAPAAYTANSNANTVSVIDLNNNTIFATVYDVDSPYSLAVSPGTSRLYVTDYNINNVTIIDTSKYRVLGTIPVGNMPFGIAVSPDGGTAYVANNWDNTVSVINTSDKKVNNTINVGKRPEGARANPVNGDVYVINSADGTVSAIRGKSVIATIPVGKNPSNGLDVTPDGELLFVVNTGDNDVTVINTTTLKAVRTIDTGKGPTGIAISPDGMYAFISNPERIDILLISDYSIRVSLNVANASTLAFKPDGGVIYALSRPDGRIRALESATGEPHAVFTTGAADIATAMIGGSLLVDTMPPVTTLRLYGINDSSGRFISNVTCNLTAVDYPSGTECKNIQYSMDGLNWLQYTSNFTLRNPGMVSFYYRCTDKAGNTEAVKAGVVNIAAPGSSATPSPTSKPINASIIPAPVTVMPSSTPMPSQTPKPTSGFELVLAIMSIISAGYVISKKG